MEIIHTYMHLNIKEKNEIHDGNLNSTKFFWSNTISILYLQAQYYISSCVYLEK